MRTFTMVLVGLTLLGVIFFFVAQILSKMQGDGEQAMTRAQQAQAERIAPVGTVVTGEAGAGPEAAAAGGGQSGEAVYQAACAACHAAGVAGAPKLGDKEAWAARLDQGMDAMLASVVNGKGAMPPRGGSQASDAELQSAIVHMLQETGLEAPGGGEAATATAEQPAAGAAEGAAQEGAAAQEGGDVQAAAAAPEGGESEVDLDRGREVVQQTCAACHTAGVAGAPKIGDKDAWAPLVEDGMDHMLEVAIKGQGAMPPRGGGDYTDEELRAAIQVMLNDTGL